MNRRHADISKTNGAASKTPPIWLIGSLKGHLGASFQTWHRLRDEMLETVSPDGAVEHLPPALQRIADLLTRESVWLRSLQPIPDHLRRSHRAHYLNSYGLAITRLAEQLTTMVDPPFKTEKFEPFGVAYLQLLAEGSRISEIDKRP